MSHFTDDVVLRSRKALIYVGVVKIYRNENLRAYWQVALDVQPGLEFEVQHIFGRYEMVVIVFRNQKRPLAAETMHSSNDCLVERSSGSQEDFQLSSPSKFQVDLWIKPGMEEAFLAYEHKALANMGKYGGALINKSYPECGPHERHVLAFPSKAAFEAYRRGPETLAAQSEREACIEKTEIRELKNDEN
ncbi:MAG: hypothetical protein ABJL33_19205 [Hyphomicrobiales bacterium]